VVAARRPTAGDREDPGDGYDGDGDVGVAAGDLAGIATGA